MTFTVAEPFQLVEEIKKSCFLVQVAPANTAEQAIAFIEQVSDPTATHNCWAWKIAQNYRFNDAGEPSGTAGRPMLTAIEGQHCDYLVAVVSRWFGGIKLGMGGLARAYGGGVARCLQQAPLVELITRIQCQFHCYYNEWPILENKLTTLEAVIELQSYDAEGTFLQIALPKDNITVLQQWLRDITKGRVQAAISDSS